MLKKVFIALAVALLLFSGFIAMQPAQYTVAREITINASPDVIFPFLNNAQKMNSWNPWSEIDPQVKMNFSGPEEGVGAVTSWTSEGQMGTGSATVIESIPDQMVKTKLAYTKPFEMTQEAVLTLTPAAEKTTVRWAVTGSNSFIGRFVCFFMNMDKTVGGTFEKGLSKLKMMVEAPLPVTTTTPAVTE